MKRFAKRLAASVLAVTCWLTASMSAGFSAEAAGESTFRRRAEEAWEKMSDSVSMWGVSMTVDDCIREYYDLLYTAADKFWVNSAFGYSAAGSTVRGFYPKYSYDAQDVPAMRAEFDNKIEEIVSAVQTGWSEAETVLYFHDWLAANCAYDLTYEKNDAYAAMVGGTAVCQGYALALCVLCRAVGIECYPITSDQLKHMWNVVKVDGEWYQCDITYDDISPDMLGHSKHEYVLVSDEFMRTDGYHYAEDWNYFSGGKGDIVCTSTRYENAFWRGAFDAVTPMPDGSWIYAKENSPDKVQTASDVYANIQRTSADGQTQNLRKVEATWYTPEGNVYMNCYTAAEVWDDRIYYHTRNDIYSMAMDGSDVQLFYTLTAAEKQKGRIYGIFVDENGLMTYQVMAQPMFEDEEHLVMNADYHTIQLPASAPPETTETTVTTSDTTTTTTTSTTEETTTTERKTTESTTTTTTTEDETTLSETTESVTSESTTATPLPTDPETTLTETETTVSESSEELVILPGDVDANGKVQIADAVLLARYNAEDAGVTVTLQGRLNADCDGDGMITAADHIMLLEMLAGSR